MDYFYVALTFTYFVIEKMAGEEPSMEMPHFMLGIAFWWRLVIISNRLKKDKEVG